MSAAEVDGKAGYCNNCRDGSHSLCASVRCTCTERTHRMRARAQANLPSPIRQPSPLAPKAVAEAVVVPVSRPAPTLGVVWEDPPEKTAARGRLALIVKAEPVLVEVRSRPGVWARIVSYPSKGAAGAAAKVLRKALPSGWEFKPVARRGEPGSRLYARYVGPEVDADAPLVES